MKKYVKKKDKYSNEEYGPNTGKTKYFHLYCDICGARHPDVCVNELTEEEGYPEGAYCHECQKNMMEQGLIGEDRTYYFYKPSLLKRVFRKMVRLADCRKNGDGMTMDDNTL